MKITNKFDRYISGLFFFTVISVVATSYFALKEFFASHNQRQQEAIVSLFPLITSEIIRPLSISQYMANDWFIIEHARSGEFEREKLFRYLNRISREHKMLSFIALERHNLMIDSDNKQLSLDDGKAEWFHRLKLLDKKQFTDIGNVENPHLYFDVKILDEEDRFWGFIGVGIDLNEFATTFKKFHQRFGFELFFVDESGAITLSSSDVMKTESHHHRNEIVNIDSFPWYQNWHAKQQGADAGHENMADSEEFIVSKLKLEELGWQMYLLAPAATRQNEYWQLFVGKLVIVALIALLLFLVLMWLLNYFKSGLVKAAKTDYLTGLPNRNYVYWIFNRFSGRYDNASIVLVDADNFKRINDSYGHGTGDKVLKIIANKLSRNLRKIDLVGRWGGEEFVIILPGATAEQAKLTTERIGREIADHDFIVSSDEPSFNVTVSFGIYQAKQGKVPLQQSVDLADKALYSAKANGRNRSVIYSDNLAK